jgi:hypothetical protein
VIRAQAQQALERNACISGFHKEGVHPYHHGSKPGAIGSIREHRRLYLIDRRVDGGPRINLDNRGSGMKRCE